MCGICGFNWEDKGIIKGMADSIAHRGPDQHDYYTDQLISLGHRRLSIIDLSEKGKQPMCNEEGNIWVVYNGEIYNFKEIKTDLEKKGHKFRSSSDTEVIIHAYEEYGLKCVNIFNGMFAFALWDSKNKKIILIRDRLGIKPLFYYFNKLSNKLIFASEIKSIITHPLIKRQFNHNALNQIIHYGYTINGETLLKGVTELLPGHILTYDYSDINIEKFWDIKTNITNKTETYFAKKLRDMLKESVRKRLVADVPLGASLSGGIDSSSIVAFMSKLIDNPVKTFTIGFNDESDEFIDAKRLADYCGTDHHEIIVDFKEITENLPRILWHVETVFVKPAMFATYFLSREINKNKVIIDLSGEGSDEMFAGYNRYEPYLYRNINELSNTARAKKISSSCFLNDGEKNAFFNDHFLNKINKDLLPENIFLPYLENANEKEYINAALEFEIKNQLRNIHLLRVDRMSMANSHEIRVPFLDHEVVEFAMTIPAEYKWNLNTKKNILQKAMKGLLPKENVLRKKLPFHMPLLRYFQEDLIDISSSILSNSKIFNQGFIKKSYIFDTIKKIKNKRETNDDALRRILFFINLEMFNKLYIEKDKVRSKDLTINNFI